MLACDCSDGDCSDGGAGWCLPSAGGGGMQLLALICLLVLFDVMNIFWWVTVDIF